MLCKELALDADHLSPGLRWDIGVGTNYVRCIFQRHKRTSRLVFNTVLLYHNREMPCVKS